MPFKVTLMYNLSSGGAKRPGSTESYLYLGAATTMDDPAFITDVETFMNARTEMMGSNTGAVGYRVSVPGTRSRSKRVLINTTDGANIHPGAVVSQGAADPGNSSVQCAGFSAKKQRSNKWLAGLPDAFITTAGAGGPNFSAVGLTNYKPTWDNWVSLLLSGKWGFKALADLPPDQPFDILDWSQQPDAPFECVITVANAQALWSPGQIIHIRGVIMQEKWMPRPIGRFRIRSMATAGTTTTYVLRDSAVFDASQIEQPGTLEQVDTEVVAYAKFGPENQSSKKRGPGPVLPVGRVKAPVRRKVS